MMHLLHKVARIGSLGLFVFLSGCQNSWEIREEIVLLDLGELKDIVKSARTFRLEQATSGQEKQKLGKFIFQFAFPTSWSIGESSPTTFVHIDVSASTNCRMRWPVNITRHIGGIIETGYDAAMIPEKGMFTGKSLPMGDFTLEPGPYMIFVGYRGRPLVYYQAALYCDGEVSVAKGIESETSNPRFLAMQAKYCRGGGFGKMSATWWVDLYTGRASTSNSTANVERMTIGKSSQGNLYGLDEELGPAIVSPGDSLSRMVISAPSYRRNYRRNFLQVTLGNTILFEQDSEVSLLVDCKMGVYSPMPD